MKAPAGHTADDLKMLPVLRKDDSGTDRLH